MKHQRKNKHKHKINEEIRFPKVRVIGRGEPFIISSSAAYDIAIEEEKDLILINENIDPPIVRIENYMKFIYEQEKIEKEKKRNTVKHEIKEIQLSAEIADHDLITKVNKAAELIADGAKIRCVLSMKGRQKGRPERGEIIMLKFLELIEGRGAAENLPKIEGSKWSMIVKAKK